MKRWLRVAATAVLFLALMIGLASWASMPRLYSLDELSDVFIIRHSPSEYSIHFRAPIRGVTDPSPKIILRTSDGERTLAVPDLGNRK